ncbi:MAG TPA: hypothetical protein VK103_00420 [Bacillota bacterium]|nr:hypothetical protein [Bacillota bacterium]
MTVKRTILAVAAGLLTVLALSMFATRPTTTFSTGLEGGDVVVSCHPVSVIDDSSRPLDGLGSRRYTYRIEEGRDVLDRLDSGTQTGRDRTSAFALTDRIEAHCDRRRTGRVAWMVLALTPAAVLATLAVTLPAIRAARDYRI